ARHPGPPPDTHGRSALRDSVETAPLDLCYRALPSGATVRAEGESPLPARGPALFALSEACSRETSLILRRGFAFTPQFPQAFRSGRLKIALGHPFLQRPDAHPERQRPNPAIRLPRRGHNGA